MGEVCEYCGGTGVMNQFSGQPCFVCGGKGWKEYEDPPAGSCEECGSDMETTFNGEWVCQRCQCNRREG